MDRLSKKIHCLQHCQRGAALPHPDELDAVEAGVVSRRLCSAAPALHLLLEADQLARRQHLAEVAPHAPRPPSAQQRQSATETFSDPELKRPLHVRAMQKGFRFLLLFVAHVLLAFGAHQPPLLIRQLVDYTTHSFVMHKFHIKMILQVHFYGDFT